MKVADFNSLKVNNPSFCRYRNIWIKAQVEGQVSFVVALV